MSTRARKRKKDVPDHRIAGLRSDVQEAIERGWPDGIVEALFDADESYFHEVHLTLSAAFRRIRNAQLVQEREADPGAEWWDDPDPEECPPDPMEPSRSYHTFFISPAGKDFTFETDAEDMVDPDIMVEEFEEDEMEDDPIYCRTAGTGRIGWVVAVSLLTPFAVIELGDAITYEDGSTTGLQIEPCAQTLDGEPMVDEEAHFRKYKGDQAYKKLVSLRANLSKILEKNGIAVLPREEWRKPVPWLRSDQECLIGFDGEPIRVLDAFFFESI